MRDRRGVAGAVPGGADAEELAERRHLARRAQAADLRDVDADEVDQPLGDERHVFVLRVEQLAHRDRDARLLAQQPEVVVLLGRERVFEEEQAVRLERLAEVDRLVRRDPLVHVVQQLDLVAELACAGARRTSAACARTAPAPRSRCGLVGPIGLVGARRPAAAVAARAVAGIARASPTWTRTWRKPCSIARARAVLDLVEARCRSAWK